MMTEILRRGLSLVLATQLALLPAVRAMAQEPQSGLAPFDSEKFQKRQWARQTAEVISREFEFLSTDGKSESIEDRLMGVKSGPVLVKPISDRYLPARFFYQIAVIQKGISLTVHETREGAPLTGHVYEHSMFEGTDDFHKLVVDFLGRENAFLSAIKQIAAIDSNVETLSSLASMDSEEPKLPAGMTAVLAFIMAFGSFAAYHTATQFRSARTVSLLLGIASAVILSLLSSGNVSVSGKGSFSKSFFEFVTAQEKKLEAKAAELKPADFEAVLLAHRDRLAEVSNKLDDLQMQESRSFKVSIIGIVVGAVLGISAGLLVPSLSEARREMPGSRHLPKLHLALAASLSVLCVWGGRLLQTSHRPDHESAEQIEARAKAELDALFASAR